VRSIERVAGSSSAMIEHIRPIRPARAAIAAVLALSATPLLAQELAPPPVAPTVTAPAAPPEAMAAPAPAPSAAPNFATSQPVVQSTPSVEERRAAAMAAAEAEAAAKPVPAPRRAASRPVERAAAPVAPVAVAPAAPVVAAPAVTPAPVAPVVTSEPVVATPAEPVVAEQAARPDNALLFAMGGAALLLAGLGGAALMRRRRPIEAVENDQLVAPVAEPLPIEPAPAPVVPRAIYTPPVPVTDEERTIAAMVAAPPSPENPFLTHAKRVRRAKFLLAERHAVETSPAPQQAQPVAAPAPAVDRSQTVYRFGNDGVRTGVLKPRTH
jgi:MYXO-CTERM domain-containing protein